MAKPLPTDPANQTTLRDETAIRILLAMIARGANESSSQEGSGCEDQAVELADKLIASLQK